MLRILFVLTSVALLPALHTAPAHAGKNKNSPPEGTVIGTIKSVSEDGATLTVEKPGKKKKKVASTTDIKITKDTKVVYVGIDSKDEQTLHPGYGVAVKLDEKNKDAAASIKVTRTVDLAKKRKKNS
jgi:hypothetical protein